MGDFILRFQNLHCNPVGSGEKTSLLKNEIRMPFFRFLYDFYASKKSHMTDKFVQLYKVLLVVLRAMGFT